MVAHLKTTSGIRSKASAKIGGQTGHPSRPCETHGRVNFLPAWLTFIPPRPLGVSRLNKLPYPRRQAIAEYAAAHTLAQTAAWLKPAGIKVSLSCLSEFLSGFALEQRLKYTLPVLQELLANLAAHNPALTAVDLDKIGRFLFDSMEAWKAKNALPG